MTNEMIERVVRNMRRECPSLLISVEDITLRRIAKAAILAMREPMEEMKQSYCSWCDRYSCKGCYTAMIKAALKE